MERYSLFVLGREEGGEDERKKKSGLDEERAQRLGTERWFFPTLVEKQHKERKNNNKKHYIWAFFQDVIFQTEAVHYGEEMA